jgi:hypothetical protein
MHRFLLLFFYYQRNCQMNKPKPTDYPGFFNNYIAQVPEENLLEAFHHQTPVIQEFLSSVSEDRSLFSYADGKWTIREILQHLIDAERIFTYRALCFSRKEQQSLPGFEENEYVPNSHANARSWHSLANEFMIVRQSTLALYNSFTNKMLLEEGTVMDYRTSVTTIGFVSIGHAYHHIKIVGERYQ